MAQKSACAFAEHHMGSVSPTESSLQQIRTNQAMAVVLLGVIGAEFGQEVATAQHAHAHAAVVAPEGFSQHDYSLARATSPCCFAASCELSNFALARTLCFLRSVSVGTAGSTGYCCIACVLSVASSGH